MMWGAGEAMSLLSASRQPPAASRRRGFTMVELCFPPPAPPRGRRSGGFTMVEILVVVAIVVLLASLVVVAQASIRNKMHLAATRAMIIKLRDRLEEYKNLTGAYPPDGYDSEVKNSNGTPIFGAACLYEFLTKEVDAVSNVGGQIRRTKHEALLSFTESELTPEDSDLPGVREVVDGFGLPLHYDNTENGEFHPEKHGDGAHMARCDAHPPDPRTSDDTEVVPHTGIQRPGAYDLWSHGDGKAHQVAEVSLKSTVGTWNVESEQKTPVAQ
jgi:prepilin-type N-terminal cleavage/methylation domain-containing protein